MARRRGKQARGLCRAEQNCRRCNRSRRAVRPVPHHFRFGTNDSLCRSWAARRLKGHVAEARLGHSSSGEPYRPGSTRTTDRTHRCLPRDSALCCSHLGEPCRSRLSNSAASPTAGWRRWRWRQSEIRIISVNGRAWCVEILRLPRLAAHHKSRRPGAAWQDSM